VPKVPQQAEIVKVNLPDSTTLAKQSKQLLPKLEIKITNQETLDEATRMANLADQWIENAEALTDPVVDATNKAHKAAVKLRNDLINPVIVPLKALKQSIFSYIDRVNREAKQRQLDAEAEQDRKNREEADRLAKAAVKTGADKETVEEIRDTVLSRPAPIVQPKAKAPENVSTSTRWDVDREKYDLYALCLAIVKFPKEGNHLLALIEPNFPALRTRATEGKENAVIPGFTVKKIIGGSFR
jgi:hypothetical protein